jgi:hypothetical protein
MLQFNLARARHEAVRDMRLGPPVERVVPIVTRIVPRSTAGRAAL